MRTGLSPPVVALSLSAVVFCGCSGEPAPTAPGPNGAPRIGGLTAAPSGTGIQSTTIFTFTGQGISDPEGDALTYSWTSSDGAAIVSSTQAASHVYARSGSFEMRLTVTDSKGLSASAVVAVPVGTVTGTWDITCNNHPPSFPSQFVATMTQSGSGLFGTIAGAGRSQTFPAPPNVSGVNEVRDPREVNFGIEGFYNPWDESDFYFHLTADATLTAMTGPVNIAGRWPPAADSVRS